AVWGVELAGLRTAEDVARAVATTLGGPEVFGRPGEPLLSTADRPAWTDMPVRRAARGLAGVVVLDNCEHVLETAAHVVADIVAVAPEVGVLATGRAPLGLAGEVVHRLRALSDTDALALLQARARSSGATLSLPPALAVQLCHRLDNLPLAI